MVIGVCRWETPRCRVRGVSTLRAVPSTSKKVRSRFLSPSLGGELLALYSIRVHVAWPDSDTRTCTHTTEQKKKEIEEKKVQSQERKRKWKDILEVKEELAQSDPQLLNVRCSHTGQSHCSIL
jgi:hypothetical protein